MPRLLVSSWDGSSVEFEVLSRRISQPLSDLIGRRKMCLGGGFATKRSGRVLGVWRMEGEKISFLTIHTYIMLKVEIKSLEAVKKDEGMGPR